MDKEYQITKQGLLDRLSVWDGFLKRRVHLIACGGTALTLLGVKESTKDIDLLVPAIKEYEYLVRTLQQLNYKPLTGPGWGRGDGFIFDLFRGKSVHTTELLESPLREGNHTVLKEFNHIYLGVLNYYDIIITKLFRNMSVDIQDCLALVRNKKDQIDLKKLRERFLETASYDVSENKIKGYFDSFLDMLNKEGLNDGTQQFI